MNRLARPAVPFAAAALTALLLSCGGGGTASGPAPITVAVTPATSTVYAGESEALVATLDDPAQKGVTWTLAPASGAGTLTQPNPASVTYAAPLTEPADDVTVTITATSVSDPTRSAVAMITVPTPPVAPTTLRVLYRVRYRDTDRMTSVEAAERNAYPFDGEIYYVPDQPGGERVSLNRYLNATRTDHADGTSPPAGYDLEQSLGYPWAQASRPGIEVLSEALNPSTGDHALVAPSDSLSGYTVGSLGVYGYPRFVNSTEVILSLSAGGVTVESNKAAGGVTWRWFWNGMQFENHFAYGSEIQAAFYFGTSATLNPTEAGNGYYPAGVDAGRGSPTVRFENQGNTQITRAVPLNWDPALFGGDLDHPVIWESLILGKDLTLNFNNMGPVARYTTHLTLPDVTLGTLAIPTGYVRGNLNRFWTYDAPSKKLTEVTGRVPNGCGNDAGFGFNTNYGGVIISDTTLAYAMGVYGVGIAQGGSVNYYSLWSYPCGSSDTSESAYNFNVWAAVRGNNTPFPAGESTYNTYIITESLPNVTALMDDLYRGGVR